MKKAIRVAITVSKFNSEITNNLLDCCVSELAHSGVKRSDINIVWVPGAYELPFAADQLASSKKFDAVICLGCVIKGETSHDLHVASWAANGIGQVGLKTGVPTLFGVLTPNSQEQAIERSKPGELNRGKEVAEAAIEMIRLNRAGFR